ncbi:MAG: acyl carrier protein [Bacteroidales bacterium]|jgi:acyl carrier protein|nr:acyl carrier protein [Bacteroidales bacterium]
MDIKEFVENFASQFEETGSNEFSPVTEFKTLEEWSSLIALSIIAMVDEEYEVKVKGDDIRNSTTIEDLYNIVKSRK